MRQVMAFVAGFCVVIAGGMFASKIGVDSGGGFQPITDWTGYTQLVGNTALTDMNGPMLLDVESIPETLRFEIWPEADESTQAAEGSEKIVVDTTKTTDPATDKPKEDPIDTVPPVISITSPEDGATVDGDKVITYSGKVEPGATVIASGYEADVDADGNWSIKLVLSPGTNTTLIKAIDEAGNITKKTITVYYDTVGSWEIEQFYSENTENWTKFKIWGTPGEKFTATSQYGSGTGTIGEEGYLKYLWVNFSGNAPGEGFPVTVKDSHGNSETFSFTLKEPTDLEWSIRQMYAENSENWTKFFITGEAGETVVAESAYGRTEETIGSDGHLNYWHIYFPEETPRDTPVAITISYQGGTKGTFYFTWVSNEK